MSRTLIVAMLVTGAIVVTFIISLSFISDPPPRDLDRFPVTTEAVDTAGTWKWIEGWRTLVYIPPNPPRRTLRGWDEESKGWFRVTPDSGVIWEGPSRPPRPPAHEALGDTFELLRLTGDPRDGYRLRARILIIQEVIKDFGNCDSSHIR